MRPLYIFLICICLLTCCTDSKITKKCRLINMMQTTCMRKMKRGEPPFQNYPDSTQDDEKRAMLQLRDETGKFLAMLLKEARQEKLKSDGPNQNVYGLSSYDYDFQRYF